MVAWGILYWIVLVPGAHAESAVLESAEPAGGAIGGFADDQHGTRGTHSYK
jgi:hypothetical protein